MYPWDVLGIEETDDKKTIKKAYAKLLRQYRPDEHPEKFQEVNQAYQYALDLLISEVQTMQDEQNSQPDELGHPDSVGIGTEISFEQFEAGIADEQMTEGVAAEDQEFLLVNEILEQFHQMAFAEYKLKKQPESWAFLERYHDIQDLQVRDELSKELFKRVVEYNQFQLKENKTLLLNKLMIKAIADVFDWESDWHELQNVFPEAYIEHVFKQLEPQTQLNSFSLLFLRTISVCLEFLVAIGMAKIYMLRPWAPIDESHEVLSILTFIIINIATMTSQISLSFVQYALGFRVYDKYLNLTDSSMDSRRAVVFHLLMCPLYFVYYDSSQYLSMMLPVIGFLVMLNLLCWWKNKQLFHDWISGTILMK